MNLLDRSFKNGSITAKEYRDLRKQYFGKPKLIQMDLFPDDPKKKQKGGLMEQTNGLKKMGLKKGGRIRGPKDLKDKKNREKIINFKGDKDSLLSQFIGIARKNGFKAGYNIDWAYQNVYARQLIQDMNNCNHKQK